MLPLSLISRSLALLAVSIVCSTGAYTFAQSASEVLLTEATFKREITGAYSTEAVGVEVVASEVGNPEVVDTVDIVLKVEGGAEYPVTLSETDRESGVFRAVVQFKPVRGEGEGIPVAPRQKVTFAYNGRESTLSIVGKAQLMVSPPRVYFHLTPEADVDHPRKENVVVVQGGQTIERELTITNIGDEEAYFKVWLEDFYKDDLDNIVYFTDTDAAPEYLEKIAMSKWITLRGANRILLKPNDPTPVRLRMQVPEGAAPGSRYAAIVFAEDKGDVSTGEVLGARAEYSVLATANIGTESDLVFTGEMQSFTLGVMDTAFMEQTLFTPFSKKGAVVRVVEDGVTTAQPTYKLPMEFRAKYLNTGNASFKPQGDFVIRSIFGLAAYRAPFAATSSAFPGIAKTYQQLVTTKKSAWFGVYRGEISLRDQDGTVTSVLHTPFFVLLTWHGIAAFAIVVACLLFALFVYARKKTVRGTHSSHHTYD